MGAICSSASRADVQKLIAQVDVSTRKSLMGQVQYTLHAQDECRECKEPLAVVSARGRARAARVNRVLTYDIGAQSFTSFHERTGGMTRHATSRCTKNIASRVNEGTDTDRPTEGRRIGIGEQTGKARCYSEVQAWLLSTHRTNASLAGSKSTYGRR